MFRGKCKLENDIPTTIIITFNKATTLVTSDIVHYLLKDFGTINKVFILFLFNLIIGDHLFKKNN